jgi:hypothetical protein
MEITYTATPISEVPANLMLDLAVPENATYAVIRTSAISEKVWGFFFTRTLAVSACRRYRSRDIVTR